MGNHYSHITKEHLIFLDITGEERARMIIHELGTRRISLSPIKEYLNHKEIEKALKTDMTIKQIAKKVGVHVSTVYRYLKRMRNK
ncbi:MAG: helix-turn-helix transcriptional regulator [Ignavibacteria bacterium]